MRTSGLILLAISSLIVTAGCRTESAQGRPDTGAAPEATGAAPEATDAAPEATDAAPEATGAAPAAPAPLAVDADPQAPLTPPSVPGAARSRIAGCAAGGQDAPTETPVRRGRAAAPEGPEVQVEPVAGGILVTHRARHACCLSAEITTEVTGDRVRIVERFSGKPCRCMCSSTLQTAVALAPGTWRVTLEQPRGDEPSKPLHASKVLVDR